MKTQIRLAKPHDQEPINEICNRSWRRFYPAFIGKKNVEKVVSSRKKKPRKFTPSNPKQFTLVAVQKKQIIGYLVGRIKPKKIGYVAALYVEPHFTNKGIGSRLLKNAQKRFKKRGCKTIVTETLFKNKKAIQFYTFHGFSKTKTRMFRTRKTRMKVWEMKKIFFRRPIENAGNI